MGLVFTEDQELLAESAKEVLEAEAPISRFREVRDSGAVQDERLWRKLTELGWPAIPFPEEQGGLGWGLAELAIVQEALGRGLALTPMLSVLLAGVLDPEAGAAEGAVVALAWQEGRAFDPAQVQARFDGTLTGFKRDVLDARAASSFVVSARDGDGIALFRVAASDAQVTALDRLDGRDCGHVAFEGASATRLQGGLAELQAALDSATVALAAEMLGGASAAFAMTLGYLKERVQFDVPIGSFQALQHRAVDCYTQLALARSVVVAAARDPSPRLASLVKARCSDTYLHIAKEAVQLHGGIGMTDEHDIGFHLKRAWVAGQTLGTADWHRDRWARLGGY